MGYCDAAAAANPFKGVEVVRELPTCNLCAFMSGKLDAVLKPNFNQKTIKALMKSTCVRTELPETEQEDCRRLMDENKQMIVRLTRSSQLPTLCNRIGHCMNQIPTAPSHNFLEDPKGGACTVCEYVMGIIDDALGGHATKAKIISVINSLCVKLPREIFVTECTALITEYGGEIIQLMIDDYLQPKDVCQHLHLCL